jgi:hypothetical protein
VNQITGKIVFVFEGDQLKVTECLLEPATIYQPTSIISQGLIFKKEKN